MYKAEPINKPHIQKKFLMLSFYKVVPVSIEARSSSTCETPGPPSLGVLRAGSCTLSKPDSQDSDSVYNYDAVLGIATAR